MISPSNDAPPSPLPAPDNAKLYAANAFAGRDRALLYTRGMALSPERGVELALQSMRQAGENAPPEKVMAELFSILHQNDAVPAVPGPDGVPLFCVPPMNRSSMVAKDMEQISLVKTCARTIMKFFRAAFTMVWPAP